MFKILLGLLLCSCICAQNGNKEPVRDWPSEISEQDTQLLFAKFKDGLLLAKKAKKTVSLDQVNGKCAYGNVEKVHTDSCVIKDARGALQTIAFRTIRGSAFFKIVNTKEKGDRLYFAMGILFFYDKKWDRADVCLQRSLGQGNMEAKGWIAKNQEEWDENKPKEIIVEEPQASKEPPKEVTTPKDKTKPPIAVKDTKLLVPPVPTKLPRLMIKKIDTIKPTKKITFTEHVNQGYYTLFEFWGPDCSACKKIMPMIDEAVEKRPDLILRKVEIVDSGCPVVNQLKIKTIPYFVLYGPIGKEMIRGGYNDLLPYLKIWLEAK